MNRKLRPTLLACLVLASLTSTGMLSAQAQAPAATAAAPGSSAPAAKRSVIALVAAVGDQFTYVRQKYQAGSNIIDNNTRRVIKVPNSGLNMAVLRGMDSAIAEKDPDSERIYLSLNAAEMEGVLPQDREKVAIGKIVSVLEKNPDRMRWDRLIVVTPKYLQSERQGMGPKLQGLGLYVQPLTGGQLGEFGDEATDITTQGESDTTTPGGGQSTSKTYIAPYSYIQKYELDPKTLRVISKDARHDYQKLSDPNSTALDPERAISQEVLATRITRMAERSAARALGASESDTKIEVGDVKPVKPEAAKK